MTRIWWANSPDTLPRKLLHITIRSFDRELRDKLHLTVNKRWINHRRIAVRLESNNKNSSKTINRYCNNCEFCIYRVIISLHKLGRVIKVTLRCSVGWKTCNIKSYLRCSSNETFKFAAIETVCQRNIKSSVTKCSSFCINKCSWCILTYRKSIAFVENRKFWSSFVLIVQLVWLRERKSCSERRFSRISNSIPQMIRIY
jgi:hypothetical protein